MTTFGIETKMVLFFLFLALLHVWVFQSAAFHPKLRSRFATQIRIVQRDTSAHTEVVGSGSQLNSNAKSISQVEDDGYSVANKENLFSRVFKRFSRQKKKPGTLILVRHGESSWNYNKTFTGWVDVDLSELGRREVEHAARLLLEKGYSVDVIYTSRLKRAIRSAYIILRELNKVYLPVFKSWRLNERMYGEHSFCVLFFLFF